jgi:preprotein translocase subunit YajC
MTHHIGFASLVALQAPTGGGGGASFMPLLFQFGLIFVIFYFLIIRPQQKQRKQHEASLRALKRGDRIVTAGGIIAEVIHIKDNTGEGGGTSRVLDDEVTIRSGDTRLIVERGRIAKVVTLAPEPKAKADGGAA